MRSLHLMTWSRVAVFALILSGGLASGVRAQGHSGMVDPSRSPATRPPQSGAVECPAVPPEILAEYLHAVKQARRYQWYSRLPFDRMKETVSRWQEEFGHRLQAKTQPMWETIDRLVTLPSGAKADLDGSRLVLNDKGNVTRYVLQGSQMEDLNREIVYGIWVLDPLTAPVERFAAQNEPLSTLFKRLCTLADASCSYRQDLADKIRITLDLRGKTVKECLMVLAGTAGGRVLFVGPHISESKPLDGIGDGSLGETVRSFTEQAKAPATQADPVETLRKAVEAQIDYQRKNRPVLILQLPAAGE
jgi:hypothetical protein